MPILQRQLQLFLIVLICGAFVLPAADTALAVTCKTGEHPITIINKSNEEKDLVIGVFGTVFNSVTYKLDTDHPFQGYSHPDNWVIPNGGQITWCAPKLFNGRFFARTGCVSGKCKTGDCCSGDSCPGNVCDKTSDPTSLAEVFFDSGTGSYFDISLVDGYDFPLMMKMVNTVADEKSSSCSAAGCENLPDCPWPMVNGVCLAPYKQIVLDYQDYLYRPEYYPLAAMCASTGPTVCGCGLTSDCVKDGESRKPPATFTRCPNEVKVTNPYTGAADVTLKSSGCSPINENYDKTIEGVKQGNGDEKYQITCDPTKSDSTKTVPYGTDCHPWSAAYKKYVTLIETSCAGQGVYTWQYSDTKGGRKCSNNDNLGFEITVLPRKKSGAQADMITISPDTTLKGTIVKTDAKGNPTNYKLMPPEQIKLLATTGDTLKVSLDCPDPVNYNFNCSLTYTSGKGFDAGDNKKCSEYADWTKSTINMGGFGSDNSKCTLGSDKFFLQISPGEGVKGHVCIGADTLPKSFSAANPPIKVKLADKELFRLVQDCGVDSDKKARIVNCSADFSITGGFTPRKIDGQSVVCTNDHINWHDVFVNKNLGLGAFVPDVDCVQQSYTEACPATFTQQDAQSGLRLHNNLPAASSAPLKLDHNNDGSIDLIDSIMMLRHSIGIED